MDLDCLLLTSPKVAYPLQTLLSLKLWLGTQKRVNMVWLMTILLSLKKSRRGRIAVKPCKTGLTIKLSILFLLLTLFPYKDLLTLTEESIAV